MVTSGHVVTSGHNWSQVVIGGHGRAHLCGGAQEGLNSVVCRVSSVVDFTR